MLPIYFLVIKKSDESEKSDTTKLGNYIAPNITRSPDDLGFCTAETTNHVDRNIFLDMYMFDKHVTAAKDADNGIDPDQFTKYRWFYDKSNPLTIERTIPNTNGAYSKSEIDAFGKTNKPNTYLVNKILTKYDENDSKLSQNVHMQIKPWILSKYRDCKI